MKYLKYFLVFLPAAVVLRLLNVDALWIFCASSLAILPLAGIMGEATENLSAHLGPRAGGILNATFGNATELIIAIFALAAGQVEVVKASIAGSIIGNILLVLGASMLFGGFKFKVQNFNAKAASNSSILLIFAVIALSIPAVFLHNIPPEWAHKPPYENMSVLIAGVMIVVYLLGILFTFGTHKDVFGMEHVEHSEKAWSMSKALLVLVLSTLGVAVASESLVASLEGMIHVFGWNEVFIGVIVVALIGNAAEHSTAILMAMKNKMDVAVEISVGSSLQIALFVAPVLVFVSLLLGNPMDLVFSEFELAAIAVAVFIAHVVSTDGESHWLEGVQLLGIYMILAFAFFFLPQG